MVFYKGPTQEHLSSENTIVDVFRTGKEQAIIERFANQAVEPSLGQYSNALDHALAVLLAKGQPKPDATRLIRATVESLFKEFVRQAEGKTGAVQKETWVSTVSRTKRFDPVLKELVALDPQHTDRNRLVDAGLNGMLHFTGGPGCVLSKNQSDELKKLVKARETATEEPGFVGLKLHRWPVLDMVPGGPAAEAGLRDGDVLVALNGKKVAAIRTAQDAYNMLQGPPGSAVQLAIKRGETTLNFNITRSSSAAARIETRQVATHVLLIAIPTFEGSGIADRVKRILREQSDDQTAAIIFDLRDNGGGRAEEANAVADIFLDGKLLQICAFQNGRHIAFISNPGVGSAARPIVLTNRNTASAAEMLAMALRDNSGATIVGETTAGALFGKDTADLVGGKTIFFRSEPTVLSPSGRDYSVSGIPPDVSVHDSRSKEKDDILLHALELEENGDE